jgi:hypothetical protein
MSTVVQQAEQLEYPDPLNAKQISPLFSAQAFSLGIQDLLALALIFYCYEQMDEHRELCFKNNCCGYCGNIYLTL